MKRFIVRRLVESLLLVIGVTLVVFILVRSTGDPVAAYLPDVHTPQDEAILRTQMRLDSSLPLQYWTFVSNMAHGDFGKSFYTGRPALQTMLERVPASLQLVFFSMVLSILIGILIGMLSAIKRGTVFDFLGRTISILGQSTPVFWLGLVLMWVFAVYLKALPTSGRGGFQHLILPAFTLGWYNAAGIARITRSAMLDVLDSEFIRMARAKGLPEYWVVWKHALRNALPPIVTFTSVLFGVMLAGTVVVETVFAWPGIGRLAYDSTMVRDFPVVQTVMIFVSIWVILINLLIDFVYVYLDPRIRYA